VMALCSRTDENNCFFEWERAEISKNLEEIKDQLLITNSSVIKQIEKNECQDGAIQELNSRIEILNENVHKIESNLTEHMDNGLSKRIALELARVVSKSEIEKTKRTNKFWDFMIRVVAPNGILLALLTYLMSKGG